MNKLENIFLRYMLIFLLTLLISGCESYTPEEKKYIAQIEEHRKDVNLDMLSNPDSPFNYKGKVEFHALNYFDIDPSFVFSSKLTEYQDKDTIAIFGTKGEERSSVRYGYLKFNKDNKEYKLNVYENESRDNTKYYSIWFTDRTTNQATYGVGRYLEFELNSNKEFVYTIDFNLAFNPYCAYSPDYSCAIPSKEDYLDLAVEAGEKKFHD